jgi:phenylalanyl-tRNA synthetase alpha chain
MSIEELSLELNSVQLQDEQALEQFRIRFLGSKNVLKDLYAAIKDIPNDQKRAYGQQVNALKEQAEQIFHGAKAAMTEVRSTGPAADLSKPVGDSKVGAHHPLSLIRREIIEIFNRVGFVVSEGPEIEDDWHNFSALNFAPEHPARDMQDTFFIQKGAQELALRTHTSSVQVRVMENQAPPIRTISPGRVYRNEAISARAHCFFHQVEGLYIDKNVSFADLKQTLLYFAQALFGTDTQIRLRPSYFPFTEPSAEVDVSCSLCAAKGCNVC